MRVRYNFVGIKLKYDFRKERIQILWNLIVINAMGFFGQMENASQYSMMKTMSMMEGIVVECIQKILVAYAATLTIHHYSSQMNIVFLVQNIVRILMKKIS